MKPLLAATIKDVAQLKYPVVVSPKLDGVRAIVQDGVVLSRSLKPIPNAYVQQLFKSYNHFDGELIVGLSNAPDVYRKTVSGVMSHDGEPDVVFCAFDYIAEPNVEFSQRFGRLANMIKGAQDVRVQKVKHHRITTPEALLAIEADYLAQGYEGVVVRDPEGRYKYGRSTLNDGILGKLKRFEDAEAVITGFEELMQNNNAAQQNELGNTKRSSHKENLVGRNTLGALCVRNVRDGVEFKIGTGFTEQQRQEYWRNRSVHSGRIVVYKYFSVGVKEAPRHPVFKGFRDRRDL
jgi:DNA ligase 1